MLGLSVTSTIVGALVHIFTRFKKIGLVLCAAGAFGIGWLTDT